MARAVLGVFPQENLSALLQELEGAGVESRTLSIAFPHRDASVVGGTFGMRGLHELRVDGGARLDGAGPIVDRAERFGPLHPATTHAAGGVGSSSLVRAITKEGIPEVLARAYVSELEDGGALLATRVSGGRVGRVVELMNRHVRRTVATAGAELDEEAGAVLS